MTALSIPQGVDRMTTVDAALAYTQTGWYVLPVIRGKHPGSYVGRDWPTKSSRDPDRIHAWFTRRPDLGIALHVGRSGAVAFDVDEPDHMPWLLVKAIAALKPPYQSTRLDYILRGHYVFALPDGVMFGNGRGSLRTDPSWGDVRGRNGIIVAAPTPHPKTRNGGQYRWVITGELPELPRYLGKALITPYQSIPPRHIRNAPTIHVDNRIRRLLDTLGGAKEGERNSLLFWTACRLGEMTAQRLLEHDTAHRFLTAAGVRLGLTEREAAATVASGLNTGNWVST